MISAGSGQIPFGPFILDDATRELRRDGESIHLTPKAFDLLSTLVEQRPRAVAKSVLYERLWPNTFVDEANLSILVGEIRAALGDSAQRHTFIRTLHGFGYAFCGETVSAIAPPTGSPAVRSSCFLVSRTRHVALHEGENIVGRDPSSDVWLDAQSISRRHARIVVTGAGTTVEDAGSKNGTWLKGRRLGTAEPLSDGDELMFGSIVMTPAKTAKRMSSATL